MLADELLKDPEFVPLMRSVALGCLRAVTHRFIMERKETIEVPDFKIQAQMFFGLMAHMEGEPVKRIIHQHLGAGGKLDLGSALQESPELAQAVEKELQKAKWRTSGHQAHKRPAKAAKEQPAELVEDAEGAKPVETDRPKT
jgi:hypothetical protein